MSPEEEQKILNGPALEPPDGVEPNFVDPPNGTAIWIFVTTLMAVVTFTVVPLRLYTKGWIIRSFSKADYLIGIAAILMLGFDACCVLIIRNGPLIDMWNFQVKNIPNFSLDFYLAAVFHELVFIFLQAGTLLEYTAIFIPRGSKNFLYWTAITLIVLNTMLYTTILTLLIIWCLHDPATYDPMTLPSTCLRVPRLLVASQAFNIVSDAFILLMPYRVIWSLKLRQSRKITVSLLFIGGIFAWVCTVMALVYALRLEHSENFTYAITAFGLWKLPEAAMGFTAACVPVIPRFFQEPRIARLIRKWTCTGPSKKFHSQDQVQIMQSWHGNLSTDLNDRKLRREYAMGATRLGSQDQPGRHVPPSIASSIREDDENDEIPSLLRTYGIMKTVDITMSVTSEPAPAPPGYNPRQLWDDDPGAVMPPAKMRDDDL